MWLCHVNTHFYIKLNHKTIATYISPPHVYLNPFQVFFLFFCQNTKWTTHIKAGSHVCFVRQNKMFVERERIFKLNDTFFLLLFILSQICSIYVCYLMYICAFTANNLFESIQVKNWKWKFMDHGKKVIKLNNVWRNE